MKQITIEWKNSVRDIPEDLWQLCFPLPLEGKFWYQSLEDAGVDDQFKFAYGLIKQGTSPVGIVPCFQTDVPIELVAPGIVAKLLLPLGKIFPSLLYQRTLFIGSPCSDEGTVGLIPTIALADVAEEIHLAVEGRAKQIKAPMIVWKDFIEADSQALNNLSQAHNLFKMTSYPGTCIKNVPASLEQYYKNLKGSRRHNVRKKLRKGKDKESLSIKVIKNPSPELQEQIFALYWQTYQHGKTKFEKLTPKFFAEIAKHEYSHFVLLYSQEKLVAFMLCFRFEKRVVNKFIGLDYQRAKDLYLYFQLFEAALTWAISQNAKEFQSGQTGYRPKLEVGHELIPLTNYCKHANPIIHRIYSLIAKTISWRSLDEDLKIYLTAHPQEDLSIQEGPQVQQRENSLTLETV